MKAHSSWGDTWLLFWCLSGAETMRYWRHSFWWIGVLAVSVTLFQMSSWCLETLAVRTILHQSLNFYWERRKGNHLSHVHLSCSCSRRQVHGYSCSRTFLCLMNSVSTHVSLQTSRGGRRVCILSTLILRGSSLVLKPIKFRSSLRAK